MMLHTKYQGSRPSGFKEEDFSCFPYVKHMPLEWAYFWPQVHNLNKLGKGLLDDATY